MIACLWLCRSNGRCILLLIQMRGQFSMPSSGNLIDTNTASALRKLEVSGATFAAFDPKYGGYTLLQEGNAATSSSAGDDATIVSLPINELPDAGGLLESKFQDKPAYDRFCHALFQELRFDEGMGPKHSPTVFRDVPDFLNFLEHDSESKNNAKIVSSEEMCKTILLWRTLHWLDKQSNESFFHTKSPDDLLFRGMADKSDDFYFPEFSILNLDNRSAWGCDETNFENWQSLRRQCDAGNDWIHSDIEFFNEIYGTKYKLAHFKKIAKNTGKTYAQQIRDIHEKSDFPVPSYYYLVKSDGRKKLHFAAALFRSDAKPFVYYDDQDNKKSHSAVLICIGVLNNSDADRAQCIYNTLRKSVVFDVLDKHFIRALSQIEKERSAERIDRILTATTLPSRPGVFVLGSFDHTVSFYSQQCRALMLARAIHEGIITQHEDGGAVPDTRPIAVIGGGVAGVTIAAALAVSGQSVVLYEAEDDLMMLQSKARHRFVHPHIVRWPDRSALDDSARLPLLQWRAGSARNVIERIRQGFDNLKNRINGNQAFPGFIDVQLAQRVEAIHGSAPYLNVYRHASGPKQHSLVIVSIGYGLEQSLAPFETHSYWEADAFEHGWLGAPHKAAVIGSGDGALIDLARLTLQSSKSTPTAFRPFNHRELQETILNNSSFSKLANEFQKIDIQRKARIISGRNTNLSIAYENAYTSLDESHKKLIISTMNSLSRKDTDTYLLHRSPEIFNQNSMIINKVIAFAMLKSGITSTIKIPEDHLTNGSWTRRDHPAGWLYNSGTATYSFDRVVPRIGPDSNYVSAIAGLEGANRELGRLVPQFEIADQIDDATDEFYLQQLTALNATE